MAKPKCTIRVNGGKEIDIEDKEAAIAALTPMVERAIGMTKPATVGDNSDVKSFVDRAGNIMDEIEGGNESLKDLWVEAKAKGLDVKALKAVVKQSRKPIDDDFKQKVNYYSEATGQGRLFA